MMRRWWFLRLSAAAHIPTWASDELVHFRESLRAARDESRIGPVPPPAAEPHKAHWSLLDRQNDPALGEWRAVPRPDSTPRLWDSLPHH